MLRKRVLDKPSEASSNNSLPSPPTTTTVRTSYFPSFKGRKRFWIHALVGALLLVYGAIPVAFYFSGWFRRFLIFGHYFNWPPLINFSETESRGLPHTRSFFVESEDGVVLGVWHVPPKSEWQRYATEGFHAEAEFQDARPVVIYYHGHAETRAADYRVQLYRRLSQSEVDAHVIAFDYRGFGDSTNAMPSRDGVLRDSMAMYEWVRRKVPASRIVVWGHSLGTGVAVQLAEVLARLGEDPAAVVLEAPFNSLVEAALRWPLTLPYRFIPGVEKIIAPLAGEETEFETERRVGSLTVPLLVLHSKDDPLVPYDLGQKLLRRIQRDRAADLPSPVFYDVDSSVGPGHRGIYKDPIVSSVVAKFITSCME